MALDDFLALVGLVIKAIVRLLIVLIRITFLLLLAACRAIVGALSGEKGAPAYVQSVPSPSAWRVWMEISDVSPPNQPPVVEQALNRFSLERYDEMLQLLEGSITGFAASGDIASLRSVAGVARMIDNMYDLPAALRSRAGVVAASARAAADSLPGAVDDKVIYAERLAADLRSRGYTTESFQNGVLWAFAPDQTSTRELKRFIRDELYPRSAPVTGRLFIQHYDGQSWDYQEREDLPDDLPPAPTASPAVERDEIY